METFSALLALCDGNSQVTGEFPSQRPVTRSFGVFFDLRLNRRLGKPTGRLETPSRPSWRYCYAEITLPKHIKIQKFNGIYKCFCSSELIVYGAEQ